MRDRGARLIFRQGDTNAELLDLIEKNGASSIYYSRRYDPQGIKQESSLEKALEGKNIQIRAFNSNLLHEPSRMLNGKGQPYKVFTAFWKHFCACIDPAPPAESPDRVYLPNFELVAASGLDHKFLNQNEELDYSQYFEPGEQSAQKRLSEFCKGSLFTYAESRDRPYEDGVSMLSAHLHFGEISPRQIWYAVKEAARKESETKSSAIYLKEIGWREFAHNLLFHFPDTVDKPLYKRFELFPWSDNKELLAIWQQGRTGYPIVDAGMKQLNESGWMHNRVRMIVASFLTKDLRISWTHGARYFYEKLLDADLANNSLGWQWAAGCGADAAPYFRIFNPVMQAEKFDPDGEYVKHWLPELKELATRWIHKPWQAPAEILDKAGMAKNSPYRKPVVDHALARRLALEAFAQMKKQSVESVV